MDIIRVDVEFLLSDIRCFHACKNLEVRVKISSMPL